MDAALLAACQARAHEWCGDERGKETKPLSSRCFSVKGTPWRLAVTSHRVQSPEGASSHMVLSFALHCPGLPATLLQQAPGSTPSAPVLSDLLLHWGCCKAPGDKWHAPPPGWHTSPPVSHDAGFGAWQTPFAFQDAEPKSGAAGPLQVLLLQLPLQGPMKSGGLCFLLKTGDGQWLQDKDTHRDFFLSTGQGSTEAPELVMSPDRAKRLQKQEQEQQERQRRQEEQAQQQRQQQEQQTRQRQQQQQAQQQQAQQQQQPAKDSSKQQQQQQQQQQQGRDNAASKQRILTQAERNAQELPDITKGVPWRPNEGPKVDAMDDAVLRALQSSDEESLASKQDWFASQVFGEVDENEIKAFVKSVAMSQHASSAGEDLMQNALLAAAEAAADASSPAGRPAAWGVSAWMVDAIAAQEKQAERSLMHRFDTAQRLVEQATRAPDAGAALTAVLMWLRLSAARHLTWNRNYNVKPREISGAQDRLNASLSAVFESRPTLRHVVVPAMAAAGRGGSSDVGQRIRDEILAVQSRNACKGGMMEEWHQKLHNNTSPDDVVICQALIAMLEEGLDIRAYWRELNASNITAQRLASFDRPIRNEPRFVPAQVPGLLADLRAYLQTLQAVHSGADLGSAAGSVLGFSQKSMKGKLVTVDPVPGAASPQLRQLLLAVLYQQREVQRACAAAGNAADTRKAADKSEGGAAAAVSAAALMLQLVLLARRSLRPVIQKGSSACGGRLRDLLFLDQSLDSTARTTLETVMAHVKTEASAWRNSVAPAAPAAAAPSGSGSAVAAANNDVPPGLLRTLRLVTMAVENAAVSAEQLHQYDVTEDLCKSLKWLNSLNVSNQMDKLDRRDWAMQVVAVVDRLKRSLSDQATEVVAWLQPTALALGSHLNVPKAASCLMCEDAARGTSIAPVAQLLAAVEPSIRRLGGQGDWQVISRGAVGAMRGRLRFEPSLASVQYETCNEPTVLLIDHISGHEEVPEGAVAVLTSGDCPDVLSHSAVRARNMGVLMAACLSAEGFTALKGLADSQVSVSLVGAEVKVNKV